MHETPSASDPPTQACGLPDERNSTFQIERPQAAAVQAFVYKHLALGQQENDGSQEAHIICHPPSSIKYMRCRVACHCQHPPEPGCHHAITAVVCLGNNTGPNKQHCELTGDLFCLASTVCCGWVGGCFFFVCFCFAGSTATCLEHSMICPTLGAQASSAHHHGPVAADSFGLQGCSQQVWVLLQLHWCCC